MSAEKSRFPPKSIALVAVEKASDLVENLLALTRLLLDEQTAVTLILSNRPIKHFLVKAEDFGLDLVAYLSQAQMSIVDLTSRYIGDQGEDIPNTFYVTSPSDISELALVASEAISSLRPEGEKMVLIDSVSTLALYNTAGGILRFLHFLVSKLRVIEFGGLIIVVRDTLSDPMVQSLEQYCDNLFRITKGKLTRMD